MYPSSVVQTGVKFFGCENRMAQPFPIHSWKLIRPCVVSAVKLGASLLILSDMTYLRIVKIVRSLYVPGVPLVRRAACEEHGGGRGRVTNEDGLRQPKGPPPSPWARHPCKTRCISEAQASCRHLQHCGGLLCTLRAPGSQVAGGDAYTRSRAYPGGSAPSSSWSRP